MKIDAKVHYLIASFRKSVTTNRKKIRKGFAVFLTIITLFSAIPLLSDTWRGTLKVYLLKVINKFPGFAAYFYDPRAFIFYTIGLFIWLTLVYYKYEVHFLKLALANKREIEQELPRILNSLPRNHFLALLIGKLDEKALSVIVRRGTDIIAAIDKNIKKYERVYWISGDEIGIIFYEANDRPAANIVEFILNRKLTTEIGPEDAFLFLDNFKFAIVEIKQIEELHKIESRARAELSRIENEKMKAGGNATPVKEEIRIV